MNLFMATKQKATAPEDGSLDGGGVPMVNPYSEAAGDDMPAPAEESQHEKTKTEEDQPAEESSGLCVYLGPSIRGVILQGTVYPGGRKATLSRIADILKNYPIVADLIVPGDILPTARIQIKTPGNLLYANYSKLARRLNKKEE